MQKKNMVTLPLNGIPVTVWFVAPTNPDWVKSIQLESNKPNLAMSIEQADALVRMLVDEWVFSEEENELLRNCGCGEDHVN